LRGPSTTTAAAEDAACAAGSDRSSRALMRFIIDGQARRGPEFWPAGTTTA